MWRQKTVVYDAIVRKVFFMGMEELGLCNRDACANTSGACRTKQENFPAGRQAGLAAANPQGGLECLETRDLHGSPAAWNVACLMDCR
jgi:hypothetical protein